MKHTKKYCIDCKTQQYIVAHGRCSYCNSKHRAETIGTQIAAHSENGKERKREERAAMLEFWKEAADIGGGHECMNCAAPLGRTFRAVFVAHIYSKGANERSRCDKRNFMLLCFDCHHEYDHGKYPERMKVWEWTRRIIEMLKREL